MRRRPEEEEEEEELDDEDYSSGKRRRRSQFIDDVAVEDDEDDYEVEDENPRGRKLRRPASQFLDIEAVVDGEEEEEEEEGEEDFVDPGVDTPEDEVDGGVHHRLHLSREDEQLDVDKFEKEIQDRYARTIPSEYDEETTDVEQQALLPSVKDSKLWMVKCAIGHEREAAVCLMQKYIDKGMELQIRSVVALDHLKNYIYIEADKEAHVKEACKGLCNIYSQKVTLVPIKEMTEVLLVESKSTDIERDIWVRMKLGTYKGDLARVVDVDNVRQRVQVKLMPRIDLQALVNKLDGKDVPKKKGILPPARLFNTDEARDMNIRVERKRSPEGIVFESIDGMLFKDGFLYKRVSMKSISTQNVQPTIDELEKFRTPGDEDKDSEMKSLSALIANRKKGHFRKGDAVIVVEGDLNTLMGWVEKVDEGIVYIKHNLPGLPETLAVKEKELCKCFKCGDHVKVVSGAQEGATGLVVNVDKLVHVLTILSDATKEHIRVFADHAVKSSEVSTGVTKIGDYELRDLVMLNNMSFGVIIRVESEAFQVLKGVPDRPEVALVRLREIKYKIERKANAQDCEMNTISLKDVVRIIEGPCKGKRGSVEHIYGGVLFIYNRQHHEHAGFMCAKAWSCVAVGGSRGSAGRNGPDSFGSRISGLRASPQYPHLRNRLPIRGPLVDSGGRYTGRRGSDSLIGKNIKIIRGSYKGQHGRVVDVKQSYVCVEVESLMKEVIVCHDQISDASSQFRQYRNTPTCFGRETPLHSSRTPLLSFMTPMRDYGGATPIHDGMRTPKLDRAWNPYAPMSPASYNWEEGNPAFWESSPQYQPGIPARPYEAPTPGSGWDNTPCGCYSEARMLRDSSPVYANAPSPCVPLMADVLPVTPSSASYLPGKPGGQC